MMRTKNFFIQFSLITLISFIAFACDRTVELSFEDFDKDEDNLIDNEEFAEVFTANYYDDWNNEDDEYLDDEDFYVSVYRMWDADNDDYLTEQEWIMGYDYYYGDYIINDYETIDIDGDGFIEYAEFNDALSNTDFYVSWDADTDESLSEEELADGVFTVWDVDQSGFLERDEYEEFDNYYLDI